MGRGRGVSYGGGQSSLDYLFGGGDAKPASEQRPRDTVIAPPPAAAKETAEANSKTKEVAAGVRGSQSNNNYFRAQGQNCGNFLTVSLSAISSSPVNLSHACFFFY